MGKVLTFRPKPQTVTSEDTVDRTAAAMKALADNLDSSIVDCLQSTPVNLHEVAGLLAHRLGSLMRHMDQKSELWSVCEQVLKKQAAID